VAELQDELKVKLKQARDIAALAEKEDRDFSAEEAPLVKAAIDRVKEIQADLKRKGELSAMRQAVRDLGEDVGFEPGGGQKQRPDQLWTPSKTDSVGKLFVDSPEFKALMGQAPNGKFGEKQRVASSPVGYKALVTGASDTSAGAFVQNDWLGLQVDVPRRQLTMRDLVTTLTTNSDTVEYARITGFTNNAAPVAEATAATGTSGTKPESGFTTDRVTAVVKTIANWMPVTKRALSDAGQVRLLIDAFLMANLEEALDTQMIAGDGTGENFVGLANTSGLQTQAWDTNIFRTLRKAKTKVKLIGRRTPTAYLLNPLDMETADLEQDLEGRYYLGGPTGGSDNAPLWRLPVIESEATPQGVGYVGDWRWAVLWDREESSVTATDSHENYFVRNLVAILAEMRAAFGILQPSAFVKIDLTAGA
jgi:HK97 family phage major capsid protein